MSSPRPGRSSTGSASGSIRPGSQPTSAIPPPPAPARRCPTRLPASTTGPERGHPRRSPTTSPPPASFPEGHFRGPRTPGRATGCRSMSASAAGPAMAIGSRACPISPTSAPSATSLPNGLPPRSMPFCRIRSTRARRAGCQGFRSTTASVAISSRPSSSPRAGGGAWPSRRWPSKRSRGIRPSARSPISPRSGNRTARGRSRVLMWKALRGAPTDFVSSCRAFSMPRRRGATGSIWPATTAADCLSAVRP